MATTYTIERGARRWSVPGRYDLFDAFVAMHRDENDFPFEFCVVEHDTDDGCSQELHTCYYPADERAEARWIIQHPDGTPVVIVPRSSILAAEEKYADDPDEGIQ